jgi:hypothetical protein
MRGRSNRTAEKRRLLLEVVAQGYSVTMAAERVGMSRQSVYDWKAEDPTFAADLNAAYEEGTDRFADALYQRALLPDHDVLAIFLLKQRDPRRFNQRMVEVRVAGDPDNPIGIEHRLANNGAWIYPKDELQRDTTPLLEATRDDPEDLDPDEEEAA